MIPIPAGPFQMGCDSDNPNEPTTATATNSPLHTVTLSGYYIDKYEVTNARYQACVDAGACTAPHSSRSYTRDSYYGNPTYANYPVIYVDWYQADAFCAWEGKRLPTEAEWEKAARGANSTRVYPWGDAAPTCDLVNGYVNVDGSWKYCVGDTAAVGSYPAGASPYGVMDLSGNVWEWANDCMLAGGHSISPGSNPPGPETGSSRGARRLLERRLGPAPPTASTAIRAAGTATSVSAVPARSDAGFLVSGFLRFWNGGAGASPPHPIPAAGGSILENRMGRRFYRLWPELISFENLYLAYRKAARGKRSKPAAAGFEFGLEENLLALRQELREGRYQPGRYASFSIHDPKRRLGLSAA